MVVAALAVSAANSISVTRVFITGSLLRSAQYMRSLPHLWRPAPLIYMVPPCTVTASGETPSLRLWRRATRDWASSTDGLIACRDGLIVYAGAAQRRASELDGR